MESKLANCSKYISQQAKNRLSQVPLSGLPRENSLARIRLFQKAICRDIFQAEQERRRSLAGLQRGKRLQESHFQNPPCNITKACSVSTG